VLRRGKRVLLLVKMYISRSLAELHSVSDLMLYNFQTDVLWENTNYSWVNRTDIGIPKSKYKK